MAWHGMALMLLAGCAPAASSSDPDVESLLRSLSSNSAATPDTSEYSHDFGPVLTRGQTLRHEFPLRNPGEQPLRILNAEALTPCCSSVGPLPEAIPPHGEAKIPVLFKPGFASGRKAVQFLVGTDSTEHPVYTLTLHANVIPEFEVTNVDETGHTQRVGETGRRRLRVVCRRIGDEGLYAPTTIEATAPLATAFLDPGTESSQTSDQTTEWSRDIEVTTPAESEPGQRSAELVFHWNGGLTRRHSVEWHVKPCLEVAPPGILMKAAEGHASRTIEVRSDETPIRILEVSGACLAEPAEFASTEPARRHKVRLLIDPPKATDAAVSEVRIVTDHPRQSSVVLSVVTVPMGKAIGP